MFKVKRFASSEGNVWKYVFDFGDAIAESVLYRYNSFEERTVICCSVQSGCPVGCKFCGTGRKFVRNLDYDEIKEQVYHVLNDHNINRQKCRRLQVMFMSMGEPMLNWPNVKRAIQYLNIEIPNAELLISTMGVDNGDVFVDMTDLSMHIDKIGLQFSIHQSSDAKRSKLIPFQNKAPLRTIRDWGLMWWKATNRNPFLNYCISDIVDGVWNDTDEDVENICQLFSPLVFNFTCSVVCSADETMKKAAVNHLSRVQQFSEKLLKRKFNVRVFDPAGQDDIGGGCGQLWYVQNWMKNHAKENR